MSEIIVKITDSRIKLKGGEYVRDLIRCRDCKYIKEEHFNIVRDGYSCDLSGLMVELEHYCSYGKRA